jgi:hypothetical protein
MPSIGMGAASTCFPSATSPAGERAAIGAVTAASSVVDRTTLVAIFSDARHALAS